jgi:hypothetical protein
MKLFTQIFLVSCVFLFNSCDKSSEPDDTPYYQFLTADIDKLLQAYEVGVTFNFINQDDEQRSFVVTDISNTKEEVRSQGGLGPATPSILIYSFDKKVIELKSSNSDTNYWSIIFIRKPIHESELEGSSLTGTVKTFPHWNPSYYPGGVSIDYSLDTTSKSFNGATYLEVYTIEVLDVNTNDPDSITLMYYDEKFGIIGFDDLKGKQWRLQN